MTPTPFLIILSLWIQTDKVGIDYPIFKNQDVITVYMRAAITPDDRQQKMAINHACYQWGRVINKEFQWTDSLSDANIIFDIGGKSSFSKRQMQKSVLAMTTDYYKQQVITIAIDNRLYSRNLLHTMILHEMGHALGLKNHDAPGTVMEPAPQRTVLSVRDVRRIRKLYGVQ